MRISNIIAFDKNKLKWLTTGGHIESSDNYSETNYLLPSIKNTNALIYNDDITQFKRFRGYYENKFNDYFLKDKLNVDGDIYSLKDELANQTVLDLKTVKLDDIRLKLTGNGSNIQVLIAPGISNSIITADRDRSDYYTANLNHDLNKVVLGENNKLVVLRLPNEIKAKNLELVLNLRFVPGSEKDLQNAEVFKSLFLKSFNGGIWGFKNNSTITIKAATLINLNSTSEDKKFCDKDTYIVNLLAPIVYLYNDYGKFKELNIKCKELSHSKNFYHNVINKLSACKISLGYNDTYLTINEFYPPADVIKIQPFKNRGEVTVFINKVVTDKKLITFDCPNNVKIFYKDSEKPIRGKVLYV